MKTVDTCNPVNPLPEGNARLTRRSLLRAATLAPLVCRNVRGQAPAMMARELTEWIFVSRKPYQDPFNEIEVDAVVRDPQGREQRVPGFWAGGQEWRVRSAADTPGRYSYETVCSDRSNPDLHGRRGTMEVLPYAGANALLTHGPVRVAPGRRYFEHADGTPFFWLADTWWMGLTKRLRWPADFERLTADRVAKGFTVVQIVAGLYPDMPSFDPRGANEAGFPWAKDYARINPAYFDMADLRMQHLVDQGIAPCIVGCWGYYLPLLGLERMKRHWRYLIARWGAHPVFWCLAGEGTMPYYLSASPKADQTLQKHGWTEIGAYVRAIDPYHHLITIHPSESARSTVEDVSVLDFDMLQTGHSDRASIPNTIRLVTASRAASPAMPVIDGEVCYEGILEQSRQEVQRFMFWSCILSGAAGHTYGANGIWQVNTVEHPFGPSPHGRSWGDTPWSVASELPGSRQLGWAKALLMRYPWWRLVPHPEWVEPHWTASNYIQPYCAGIARELRIVFMPAIWNTPKMLQLEPGLSYRAFYFNPATGAEHPAGTAVADATGAWQPPVAPVFQDWVLVLDR
ncbi:MAG TPA: DUF4038 domain-containing protein [Bryobacteraceae bacterium]|nr:DUF4038 domain-containing protein [Bryobacteraceae bacterium]